MREAAIYIIITSFDKGLCCTVQARVDRKRKKHVVPHPLRYWLGLWRVSHHGLSNNVRSSRSEGWMNLRIVWRLCGRILFGRYLSFFPPPHVSSSYKKLQKSNSPAVERVWQAAQPVVEKTLATTSAVVRHVVALSDEFLFLVILVILGVTAWCAFGVYKNKYRGALKVHAVRKIQSDDKMSRSDLRFKTALQAETRVEEILREEGWRYVFPNRRVAVSRVGHNREIDVIAVGPRILVVEVKHWRGYVWSSGSSWYQCPYKRAQTLQFEDVLSDNVEKAASLRRFIENYGKIPLPDAGVFAKQRAVSSPVLPPNFPPEEEPKGESAPPPPGGPLPEAGTWYSDRSLHTQCGVVVVPIVVFTNPDVRLDPETIMRLENVFTLSTFRTYLQGLKWQQQRSAAWSRLPQRLLSSVSGSASAAPKSKEVVLDTKTEKRIAEKLELLRTWDVLHLHDGRIVTGDVLEVIAPTAFCSYKRKHLLNIKIQWNVGFIGTVKTFLSNASARVELILATEKRLAVKKKENKPRNAKGNIEFVVHPRKRRVTAIDRLSIRCPGNPVPMTVALTDIKEIFLSKHLYLTENLLQDTCEVATDSSQESMHRDHSSLIGFWLSFFFLRSNIERHREFNSSRGKAMGATVLPPREKSGSTQQRVSPHPPPCHRGVPPPPSQAKRSHHQPNASTASARQHGSPSASATAQRTAAEEMPSCDPAAAAEAAVWVAKAQQFLDQLNGSMHDPAALRTAGPEPWAALSFQAKQEVLGQLRWRLPPPAASQAAPSAQAATAGGGGRRHTVALDGSSGSEPEPCPDRASPLEGPGNGATSTEMRLRVVPDAEVEQMGRPSLCEAASSAATTPETLAPVFTPDDLVKLLALYARTESDDGVLLLQLTQELKKGLETRRGSSGGGGAGGGAGGGVSQLLFLFSDLKVIDEDLLERLIGPLDLDPPSLPHAEAASSPQKDTIGKAAPATPAAESKASAKRYPLYAELPHYELPDMLLLGAALHRFGLHEHTAFRRFVKQLRRLHWNRRSGLGAFNNSMVKLYRRFQSFGGAGGGPEAEQERLELLLQHAASQPLVETVQLDAALFPLVVECLDALALSPYRHPQPLQCFADLLAVNTARQFAASSGSIGAPCGLTCWPVVAPPATWVDAAPTRTGQLSLQVLTQLLCTAVRRLEQMEFPHPLLATARQGCLERCGKGVVQNVEDSDVIDPSRAALYDHVTADLIKLRRQNDSYPTETYSIMSYNPASEASLGLPNRKNVTDTRHAIIYEQEHLSRYASVAPYIPTYIAAVKTDFNVTLDDVVKPQRERPEPAATVSVTNGSTGPMTETASSWVDDDEVFVQYVTHAAQRKAQQQQEKSGSHHNHQQGSGEPFGDGGRNRNQRRGRRGGYRVGPDGWQTVEERGGNRQRKKRGQGFADPASPVMNGRGGELTADDYCYYYTYNTLNQMSHGVRVLKFELSLTLVLRGPHTEDSAVRVVGPSRSSTAVARVHATHSEMVELLALAVSVVYMRKTKGGLQKANLSGTHEPSEKKKKKTPTLYAYRICFPRRLLLVRDRGEVWLKPVKRSISFRYYFLFRDYIIAVMVHTTLHFEYLSVLINQRPTRARCELEEILQRNHHCIFQKQRNTALSNLHHCLDERVLVLI
eukprot:gene6741-4834_t